MGERRPFLKHQAKAWKVAKRKSKLPLFMEMRLGKTLIAIRWAKTRLDCNKILVACPLSVVDSWLRELALENEKAIAVVGTANQKSKAIDDNLDHNVRQWFVTNYETLAEYGHKTKEQKPKAVPSVIAKLPWDGVIADESTKIRKPTAQITKIFMRTFKHTKYKAVLSGLPDPEGSQDYVTQMLFLYGTFMNCQDYYSWRAKYMIELPFGGYELRMGASKKVVEEVSTHAIRMTRHAVGIGSEKIRSVRTVTVPPKIMKAIRQLRLEHELGDRMTKTTLEDLLIEQQITGGFFPGIEHQAKLKELRDLLEGELRGQPFLVWCKHTTEVEGVTDYLSNMRLKLKVKSIHGSLKSSPNSNKKEVRARIDAFMAGKLDGLVLQPKSVQMGIDMSRADVSIYYSRWPDYEVNAQSGDRVIHPQKKVPVLELDIVVKDTVDETLPEILNDKRTNSENFGKRLMEAIFSRFGGLK